MKLRKVRLSDAKFLAQMSGGTSAHQADWICANRLADRKMFIAEYHRRPVAWGQITRRNKNKEELHWFVAPWVRKQGYGKQLAMALVRQSSQRQLIARIEPSNLASQKIARYIGMRPLSKANGWQIWEK